WIVAQAAQGDEIVEELVSNAPQRKPEEDSGDDDLSLVWLCVCHRCLSLSEPTSPFRPATPTREGPWQPVLDAVEMGVEAAPGQQFLVRPPLGDSPFVQHDNLVGVANCREPMGDQKGGASLHQPPQSLQKQLLGVGVQGAGRLVENQDGSILQQ